MADQGGWGDPVGAPDSPVDGGWGDPVGLPVAQTSSSGDWGDPVGEQSNLGERLNTSVMKGLGHVPGLPYDMMKFAGALKDVVKTGLSVSGVPDEYADIAGDVATLGLGSKPVQNYTDKHILSPQTATNLAYKNVVEPVGSAFGLDASPKDFEGRFGKAVGATVEGAVPGAVLGGISGLAKPVPGITALDRAVQGAGVGGAGAGAQEATAEATKESPYSGVFSTLAGLGAGLGAGRALGISEQPSMKFPKTRSPNAVDAGLDIPETRPGYQPIAPEKLQAALQFMDEHFGKSRLPGDEQENPYAGSLGLNNVDETTATGLKENAEQNEVIPGRIDTAYDKQRIAQPETAAAAVHVLSNPEWGGLDTVQNLLEEGHRNSVTIKAAEIGMKQLADERDTLHAYSLIPDGGDIYKSQLQDLDQRMSEFGQAVSPHISDTARSLNALNMTWTGNDYAEFADHLQSMGTNLTQDDIDNYSALFVKQKMEAQGLRPNAPTLWTQLMEFRRGSLLSSVKTFVRVSTSQGVLSAIKQLEGGLTAGVGEVRSRLGLTGLTKQGIEDRATFGGFGAQYQDFGNTILDALKTGGNALLNEDYTPKLADGRNLTAVPQYGKQIGGTLGQAVRLGGRAVLASDKFFDQATINMELNKIGFQKAQEMIAAKAMANDPDTIKQYINNFRANPDAKSLKAAQDVGAQVNLKQAAPEWVQRWFGNGPLELLFPFPRVIYNAFKQAAIRVPGGFTAFASERKAWNKGGAARDVVIARQLTGVAAGGLLASYYEKGLVTSAAPTDGDYTNTNNLRANGVAWQPNSVWVGDKWVSWENIEPLNTFIPLVLGGYDVMKAAQGQGTPMDLIQATDHHAGVPDALLNLASNAVAHHLYMQQFLDFVDALNMKGNTGAQRFNYFTANLLASTAVPRVVNDLRMASDNKVRIVDYGKGFGDLPQATLERMQNMLPGVSKDLPVKPDPLGRDTEYNPPFLKDKIGGAANMFMPFTYTDKQTNPVLSEINKYGLMMERNGRDPITEPSRSLQGYRLSSQQLADVDKMYGERMERDLTPLVTNPSWDHQTDGQKMAKIRQAHADATKFATQTIIRSTPELQHNLILNKLEKQTGAPAPSTIVETTLAHPERRNNYRPN